ncbi:hypothetical protein FO519_006760 [Halicephalobus sp. NKZ332]|nr:hypothetical protein FO519_006760 [Halicephalobus sp. NKZ332]
MIPQRHLDLGLVRSPLGDTDYAHYYDDDFEEKKSQTLIPSMTDLAKLPICQKPCAKHLTEALGVAMKAVNHYDRFYRVCEKYNETLACMDSEGDCGSRALFNVFTSGLKYMCFDQRDAFEATIECIDASATQVTGECNQQCNTRGKLADWAMQSGILEGFRNGEKVPLLNPEMMRNVMQDGCELADCHLGCMKTKFNNRCEGHAGNLISEMLVRPIGESQRGQSFKMISNIMGIFMPNQCQFIINEEQLTKFRIDPKIDDEVRQMYKDRKETEQSDPLADQGDEPKPIGAFQLPDSPLDDIQGIREPPVSSSVMDLGDDTVDYPDIESVPELTPIIAVQDDSNPGQSHDPNSASKNETTLEKKLNPETSDDALLTVEDGAIIQGQLRPKFLAGNQGSRVLTQDQGPQILIGDQGSGVPIMNQEPKFLDENQELRVPTGNQGPEIEQGVSNEFPATIVVDVEKPGPTPLGPNPAEPVESVSSFYRRMKVRCSIKRGFRRFYSGCNN